MMTMDFRVAQFVGIGMVVAASLQPGLAAADTGGSEANPYAVISDRNVFHLNPPPPPPAPAEKPPDVPKVMLSGFRTVGGNTRVFLVLQPKDTKEPMKFLDLAQGEQNNGVEVVKINSEKREVDIINTGTRMTLSFANNGVAVGAAPAASGHGVPGGLPPVPGFPASRRTGLPAAPRAAVPNEAPPASGNSAIIIGGNSSGTSSSGPIVYGGGESTGSWAFNNNNSAIVTGGPGVGAQPAPGIGSEAGSSIANALLSPASQYRVPPPAIPAPPAVQAASLIAHGAAGGPPVPPGVEDGPPDP